MQKLVDDLRLRLAEAEETLQAIREGQVDAVVVSGTHGEQVYALVGTDSIYRLIVETMKEAALMVTFEGNILFSNAQFGQLVDCPLEQLIGHTIQSFVDEADRAEMEALLLTAKTQTVKQRLVFHSPRGVAIPALVSANVLNLPDTPSICVVANDLTELENSTQLIRQLREQEIALRQTTEQFANSNRELEDMNRLMVGRELRMVDLKKEVDALFRQLGKPLRYGFQSGSAAVQPTTA